MGKASAATYTVCASGCNSATIQGIFVGNDLEPDDVVEVRADTEGGSKTYRESVSWGSNDGGTDGHLVILRGRTGDIITLHGDSDQNGVDDIATLIDIDSVNFIEVQNLNLTHPTTDGIQIRGTSTGVVVRNVTSTYSGNQGFQMEDSASATYYNIIGNNNVDDGFSMHGGTAIINTGFFANNTDGVNTVASDSTVTLTANDIALIGTLTEDIYHIDGTGIINATYNNVVIDKTGGAFTNQSIFADGTNVNVTINNASISNIPIGTSPDVVRIRIAKLNLNNVTINGNNADDANGIGTINSGVLNVNGGEIRDVRYGVHLVGTNAMIDDIRIHNTTGTGYGIYVMTGSSLNLTNSEIYSTTYAIYDLSVSGLTISKNYFHDNSNQFIDILTAGETANISYNIFSNIASARFAVAARTGATVIGNNNIFYDSDKNGKGVFVQGVATLKNNIFHTLDTNITLSGNIPTVDYNLFYNYTTKFSGSVTSTNEVLFDPQVVNILADFSLQHISLAIDTGTSVGLTSDYAGNPIYGTPDIGAYEYQPPHTIGTDKVDIGAGARIYGDGKFRDLSATNSDLADLSIAPESGNFEIYESDEVRPEWLNITDITWDSIKEWSESSNDLSLANTLHTVGDLEANKYYNVSVDDTLGLNIEGDDCTNGICKANSEGKIVFTYTGTYSTHTFKVEAGDNTNPTLTNNTNNKFNSNTTSVTLSLTTDENSTCKYSNDQNSTFDNGILFTTTGETSHYTELTNLTSGNYIYYAICRDVNSNESSYTLTFEIAPLELKIDVSSPVIKINKEKTKLKSGETVYSDEREVKLQGNDIKIKNGTVKIYRNSKLIKTITVDENGKWSKSIELDKDFSGYLKIKQFDEYGTLLATKKTKVKVDTKKPAFQSFPKKMTLVTSGKTNLSFLATDNKEVTSYKIYLGGKIYKTKTNSFLIPQDTPKGTQYLRIRAYDKAGNSTYKETFVLVR